MSSNNEARILQALRAMAWERAKGELRSMMQTCYGMKERSLEFDAAIREFIKRVEGEGLYEDDL